MKMISRQRSNSKRKLLTIILVGGIAVLLLNLPIPFFGNILAPVDTQIGATTKQTGSLLTWLSNRFKNVDTLRAERDDAQRLLGERTAELETFKAALPHDVVNSLDARRAAAERIVASVLGAPGDTPYDTLVIDKGSRDGVLNNAIVYGEAGAPLGSVVRTHTNTAVVVLFSTPGTITTLYAPREKIMAKATGVGGGVFSLLMPHGSSVTEGDVVTMPTLGGERVGTVSRVWRDPAEPGVIAAITHDEALRSLHTVRVERESFIMPSNADIMREMERFASTTEALFTTPDLLASTTASGTYPTP